MLLGTLPMKRPKLPSPPGPPGAPGVIKPPKKKKIKGKGGSSCHQCKSRRNFTALTYCTSNLDKKNKKCRKKFCGHCLKKFYKESPQAIADKSCWRCPSCRKICCCAACRRRKQKDLGIGAPPSSGGGGGSSKKPKKPKPKKPKTHHVQQAYVHPSELAHHHHGHAVMAQKYPHQYTEHGGHPVPSPVDSPTLNSQYMPSTPRDVSVPPVPTVMMPTSGLSSPMTTPLQMPTQFEFLPENLQLRDGGALADFDDRVGEGKATKDEFGDENDMSLSKLQEAQLSMYPHTVLAQHIKRHAYQSVANGHQTPFGIMYQLYQNDPNLSKNVALLLQRQDMPQGKKVEAVANALRSAGATQLGYAVQTPGSFVSPEAAAAYAQQMQQQQAQQQQYQQQLQAQQLQTQQQLHVQQQYQQQMQVQRMGPH